MVNDPDPRQTILQAPMTGFQIRSIAILFGLNAIDGFDVLSITYAAPGIVREWALQPAAMGVILSAGLAGMALGSLFLAPLADKIGRRPINPRIARGRCSTRPRNSKARVSYIWPRQLLYLLTD